MIIFPFNPVEMSMVKITTLSEEESCNELPCIEHEVSRTVVNEFLLIKTWIAIKLVIAITLFARVAKSDNYDTNFFFVFSNK